MNHFVLIIHQFWHVTFYDYFNKKILQNFLVKIVIENLIYQICYISFWIHLFFLQKELLKSKSHIRTRKRVEFCILILTDLIIWKKGCGVGFVSIQSRSKIFKCTINQSRKSKFLILFKLFNCQVTKLFF